MAAARSVVELAATEAVNRRARPSAEPYRTGRSGRFFMKAAQARTVSGLALTALGQRRPWLRRVAGAAFAAGSLTMRSGVFEAGKASAKEPTYTVVPQRERLRSAPGGASDNERVTATDVRLTQYAAGGGCACKVPPGELERILADLGPTTNRDDLVVGLEHGDDAAVVRIDGGRAVVMTADFFTPVVDDPFDWGRIAAANALSDVYAMGGEPLVAVNLLAWPRDRIPFDLAAEVLRGGLVVCHEAGCHLAGGHSIDDAEPKYGLAVTGIADPDRLLRNDAGAAGQPLTLTKPLGLGVLNNRHKATGEVFPDAVATMTALNRDAARAALDAGASCATDVTGFGLLGHLHKLSLASGVSAVIDAAAVPYLDGAREAHAAGFVPGGSRRNLEWVRPHLSPSVSEDELVLLADAQTSGGLLVAGEVPGHPVIGELIPPSDASIVVR
jgi:selenide,water dikinase